MLRNFFSPLDREEAQEQAKKQVEQHRKECPDAKRLVVAQPKSREALRSQRRREEAKRAAALAAEKAKAAGEAKSVCKDMLQELLDKVAPLPAQKTDSNVSSDEPKENGGNAVKEKKKKPL